MSFVGKLRDKKGRVVYVECPKCGSSNVRACGLEDHEYLPLDHYVCENCGFRWLPYNGHLWVLKW